MSEVVAAPAFAWTPEVVDELVRLWGEGVPTAEIGRRLGVSTSTVTGKAGRLRARGLAIAERPNPVKTPPWLREARKAAKQQVQQLLVETAAARAEPEVRPLNHKGCQFIAGQPSRHETCKCQASVIPGKAWCPEHYGRVFRPATPAEKKVAA